MDRHPPPIIQFQVSAGQPFVLVASREGGAARFVVPRRFTADFPQPYGHAKLTVEVDDDGVPRCTALEVRDGEITGGTLRKVPVAALMREALRATANEVQALPGGGAKVDLSFRGKTEPRVPRRGAQVTDEELERVRDLYRAAQERGHAPTQAVADELHLGRSTAARWVAKARERGFLGPAVRGKAGEQ